MKASTVKNPSTTTLSPHNTTTKSIKIKSAFPAARLNVPTCHESKSHDVIVAGTVHKNALLDTYKAKYKLGTDKVVTRI